MDRYFKYLSPGAAVPSVTNGTLRWSRPRRFNDLFDMSAPFSTDSDSDFLVSQALELMWERMKMLDRPQRTTLTVRPGHDPCLMTRGLHAKNQTTNLSVLELAGAISRFSCDNNAFGEGG